MLTRIRFDGASTMGLCICSHLRVLLAILCVIPLDIYSASFQVHFTYSYSCWNNFSIFPCLVCCLFFVWLVCYFSCLSCVFFCDFRGVRSFSKVICMQMLRMLMHFAVVECGTLTLLWPPLFIFAPGMPGYCICNEMLSTQIVDCLSKPEMTRTHTHTQNDLCLETEPFVVFILNLMLQMRWLMAAVDIELLA